MLQNTVMRMKFGIVFWLIFSGLWAPAPTAFAEEGRLAKTPATPEMIRQANAPLSSIMQVRLRDTFVPHYKDLAGRGNLLAVDVTMPLPKYRLLPLRQLSLVSIPAAVTNPGGLTGFGDLRFVDIAILQEHSRFLWGVGPVVVFPTATDRRTGQGKWQAGPAAAFAVIRERWMAGVLAQNPISFAGNEDRRSTNAMTLQPFVTVQLGRGWFVRSQPQLYFDWKTGSKILPLDLGVGRGFKIGRQNISWFVQPFWNFASDGHPPQYGITTGISFLYPNFWKEKR